MIELIDTSAWVVRERSADARVELADRMRAGQAATCPPIILELLYSARNVDEFRALRAELEALVLLGVGPREWARAIEVYELLAAEGGAHQRSVKHPDLLAAAAAESAGTGLVHYDEDFERIAAITGQPVRWLAPRGRY